MTPITEDLFTETDRRVSKHEEENGPLPELAKKALREDIYKQVVQETARETKFKAQLGMVVASALAKQDIHIACDMPIEEKKEQEIRSFSFWHQFSVELIESLFSAILVIIGTIVLYKEISKKKSR